MGPMETNNTENTNLWSSRYETLSVNSAVKEYGLTKQLVESWIHGGKIQFREQFAHGNPYFKILRKEVESMAKQNLGETQLAHNMLLSDLKRTQRNIRKLKKELEEEIKNEQVISSKIAQSPATGASSAVLN